MKYIKYDTPTKREERYLPIFLSAWFFTGSKKTAMFCANSLTDTKEQQGGWIVDEYITLGDNIAENNFLKLDISEDIGGVYIINQTGTDYYKIGVTKGIDNRLITLQCGNPDEMNVHFHSEFYYYKHLEKALHFLLSSNHHRGEWFVFNKDFMDELVLKLEQFPTNIHK